MIELLARLDSSRRDLAIPHQDVRLELEGSVAIIS